MFTLAHFIWIAISFILIALCLKISVSKNLTLKAASYIMTVILILTETVKNLYYMVENPYGGMNLDPQCLPFHLCRIMIFVVLYITFSKDCKAKQTAINFVAGIGTIGAFFALFVPTESCSFLYPISYEYFLFHMSLVWFGLYLIKTGYAKLGGWTVIKNLGLLFALMYILVYLNSILSVYGANYMYLTRPPLENLPFYNLDCGWWIYFIRILLSAVIVVLLFHLPFIIKEKKNR